MKTLKGMLIIIGVIIIVVGGLRVIAYYYPAPITERDYTKEIGNLQDSISKILREVKGYEQEWERLEEEGKEIKKLIHKSITDNEKTNLELIKGNLDANIQFLAKYLSTEGSDRKGLGNTDNGATASEDKQRIE